VKTLDNYFGEPGQDEKRESAPGVKQAVEPAQPATPVSEVALPASSGGLVIDAVEMSDFMRYLDRQTVTFDEQFTVITGRTGAGKSSILDAITFAIYGKSTRTKYVKQEKICRPGGYVKVSFRLGEDRYEITRGISLQGAAAYFEVWVNGTRINGKIRELEEQLENLLGLDYQSFCNSTFIRQDEMRELGASRPSERLEIFKKLFRLDVFERAQKLCKEKLADVKSQKDRLEGNLDEIKRMLEGRDVLEDEKTKLQEQVKSVQAKKPAAKKRADELEGRARELDGAYQQAKPVLEDIERIKKELGEVGSNLARAQQNAERLKIVERQSKEPESKESADGLQLREKELQLKEERHKSLISQLDELHRSRTRLDHQYEKKKKELQKRLDFEQDRLKNSATELSHDEAFKLLRLEGGLEERMARILLELDWLADRAELMERLNRERGETTGELDAVKCQTEGINADCFVVTELRRNVEQLKDDLKKEKDAYDGTHRDLDARVSAVQLEIETAGFDDEARKELADIRKALTDARARQEQLETLRREREKLAGAPGLVEEYTGRRKQFTSRLAEIEVKARELKERAVGLEEAKGAADAARQVHQKLHDEELRLLAGLDEKLKRLEQLEQEKERQNKLQKEFEALGGREEVLSTLANRVFHNRGLALFALRQLVDPLSAKASQFLADITENRFSKVGLTSRLGDKRSYGISVDVEGVDGLFHDVAEFSGGERTQINAALRLSIASELARMPRAGRNYCRMRTLIIDEGDLGSLDSDVSRNLFIHKLFKLDKLFDRVVLITHISEVSELFPAQLNVEMDALGRSHVEVIR